MPICNQARNPRVRHGEEQDMQKIGTTVVQHTRLDSRRTELSVLSTIAYPGGAG
jgi:hypothetical protein